MLHVSLKPGSLYWDVNEADLACFKWRPPQGHTALSNVLLMPSHCSLIPWERRGGGTDGESSAMCFKKGGGMEKYTWIGKIRTRERERGGRHDEETQEGGGPRELKSRAWAETEHRRERERDRWTRRKTGPLSDRMTGSGLSGKVTFLFSLSSVTEDVTNGSC